MDWFPDDQKMNDDDVDDDDDDVADENEDLECRMHLNYRFQQNQLEALKSKYNEHRWSKSDLIKQKLFYLIDLNVFACVLQDKSLEYMIYHKIDKCESLNVLILCALECVLKDWFHLRNICSKNYTYTACRLDDNVNETEGQKAEKKLYYIRHVYTCTACHRYVCECVAEDERAE